MTDDTAAKIKRANLTADIGLGAADDLTRTLLDASTNVNHATQESIAYYTDAMSAAMETSLQTSRMLTEFGRSYADAVAFVAATMSEITRESLTCRDLSDVIALQRRGTDGLNKGFENLLRLCTSLYDTWSRSLEPLADRTTNMPSRMFRATAD